MIEPPTASNVPPTTPVVAPLPQLTQGERSNNAKTKLINVLAEELGGAFATFCVIGCVYLFNPGIVARQISLVLLAWFFGFLLFVSLKTVVKWLKQRKEDAG